MNPNSIIALGSSAGGLKVLRSIVSKLSVMEDTSLLIVQHMSPSSRSMLKEILSRETHLEVHQAAHGMLIEAGKIYVCVPRYDLAVAEGRIVLKSYSNPNGPSPSVDALFESLAKEYGESSLGIVLSGTGRDGSKGIKAIKAAGGITAVQSPDSAAYDGMPNAALDTDQVDYIWTPDEIAKKIERMAELMENLKKKTDASDESVALPNTYKKILGVLKERAKVDFSLYKTNTLERRIERRLFATGHPRLEDYCSFLEKDDSEWRLLFHDILISVTGFFRDKAQFKILTERLANYIKKNRSKKTIRIWSAGCSTGEEPYSLAILAFEALKEIPDSELKPTIQVFATDIQGETLELARRGRFSINSAEGLEKSLVRKYFEFSEDAYQVRKEIKDLVLFTRHDLTRDPPFLRIDLIVCRNVFIYFDQETQERIVKVFHYSLNKDGLLFLGKSESISSNRELFQVVDNRTKLFVKNDVPVEKGLFLKGSSTREWEWKKEPLKVNRKSHLQNEMLRDILKVMTPDCIVIDDAFRVIFSFGKGKEYLKFPDGEFTMDLVCLIDKSLKNKVMTLIHRAQRAETMTEINVMNKSAASGSNDLKIKAFPLMAEGNRRIVISFSEEAESKTPEPVQNGEVRELEQELAATREHLQTVIEEQETVNEQLQALNEELQSANEEMQSTNEELETSNEELQSTNEELSTVNEEFNVRTSQLASLYNRLRTIQNAIPNPIVVLDHECHLKQINPAAEKTLGLNDDMLGQNFRLLDIRLDLAPVCEQIEKVFKSKKMSKIQLSGDEYNFDVWSHPMLDQDSKVTGAVVTFQENTQLARALVKAQQVESRLFSILNNIPALVSVKNSEGLYSYVNPVFCDAIGKSQEEILGKNDEQIFGGDFANQRRYRDFDTLKYKKPIFADEVMSTHDGERRVYQTASVPLEGDFDSLNSVCSVSIDISHRDFSERQLRNFQRFTINTKDCFLVFEFRGDTSQLVFGWELLQNIIGSTPPEICGPNAVIEVLNLVCEKFTPSMLQDLQRNIVLESKFNFEFERTGEDGNSQQFKGKSVKVTDDGTTQILITIIDVTYDVQRNLLLQQQQSDLLKSARMASLGEMAAGIAHELKTPLSIVQGHVDLINEQSKVSSLDPLVRSAVNSIEDTVNRISEIIVGLKSISKNQIIESRKLWSMSRIIKEVGKICEFHLINKGVNFDIEIPEDVEIRCQPTQISQVLINLINNSVDAIVLLQERWIHLALETQEDSVLLKVTDSGSGIPKAIAEQILTPFFTTKKDGTGLGLSLSRNILQAHNGELYIDQECDHTRFVVELPLE